MHKVKSVALSPPPTNAGPIFLKAYFIIQAGNRAWGQSYQIRPIPFLTQWLPIAINVKQVFTYSTRAEMASPRFSLDI